MTTVLGHAEGTGSVTEDLAVSPSFGWGLRVSGLGIPRFRVSGLGLTLDGATGKLAGSSFRDDVGTRGPISSHKEKLGSDRYQDFLAIRYMGKRLNSLKEVV